MNMELKRLPGLIASYRTGSNYTVSPPVTDTDIDFLVLVKDLKSAQYWLECEGYDLCGHEYNTEMETGNTTQWMALRKGDINIILQSDVSLYIRSCAATELCRTLNVKDKEDRITLFRAVKFGTTLEPEVDFSAGAFPSFKKELLPQSD